MKALNLLSVRKWLNTFVGRMILNKTVKHAATAIIGLIAGAKAQSVLNGMGVNIDLPHFTEQLQVLAAGLTGAILNWAQKTVDLDGDGVPDK